MVIIDGRVLQMSNRRAAKSGFYGGRSQTPGGSAGFLNIQDPVDLSEVILNAFVGSPTTLAENGLVQTAGKIGLGGTLIRDTSIDGDSNDFALINSGSIDFAGNILSGSFTTASISSDGHTPNGDSATVQFEILEETLPPTGVMPSTPSSISRIYGIDNEGDFASVGVVSQNDDESAAYLHSEGNTNTDYAFVKTQFGTVTAEARNISVPSSATLTMVSGAVNLTGQTGLGPVNRIKVDGTEISLNALTNVIKLENLPTFADEAAAVALATDTVYKTATGELRIKL